MSKASEQSVSVLVDDLRWRSEITDLPGLCDEVVAAVSAVVDVPLGQINVLFCDDASIRNLNATYRGQDRPTNVLSFPGGPATGVHDQSPFLGDIAIARETVIDEAHKQGKRVRDHAAHLVVHAILHLLGHDHAAAGDADVMEALERTILKSLGIADPYIVTVKESI